MEKQLKLRSKLLKILPKAVASITVTFQNPPFSPGRDHHHHHKTRPENNTTKWVRPHHGGGKGFSGPMIPDEARRKPNDGGSYGNGICYQEPTSPKISCMGQIKHNKKKKQIIKKVKSRKVIARISNTTSSSSTSRDIEVKKKHVTAFQRMLLFHVGKPKSSEGRKSDAAAPHDNNDAVEEGVPRVSQMKRFSSGRDAFANFDWKAVQVAPEEIDDYYSDEDHRVQSDTEEEEEEEEFMIPFSAPIMVGGGVAHHNHGGAMLDLKPRKEINLWKRRTMAPPIPLQLDH